MILNKNKKERKILDSGLNEDSWRGKKEAAKSEIDVA